MSQPDRAHSDRPKVEYHGEARLGIDVSVECAVLAGGRRGYVMRSLRQAIGMRTNTPVPAFERFCAEIAPKSLSIMTNTSSCFEVQMPHGATGIWVEAGILKDLAGGVIRAALANKLRANRRHLVEPCLAIMEALAVTGEIALIDEATGYQHHREPAALQDLFARLISKTAADWKQRFHPDYYRALCRLFGFPYGDKHRPLPGIIGQITERYVYLAVFPKEIVDEIKARRSSGKLHQWLTDGEGLNLLIEQIKKVTTIADSSVDYRDFDARCSQACHRPGQQLSIIYPKQGAR
ncbi:P63C domain-containing protein [Methylobacterium aquaticum]|uniref:P63C domain-containing protein n=1 Tax=Methylobacterium aquaticum TaxID=270351 RepID=UPI0019343E10|nr:P63C domain-containing protein [Methylobacterium aquaticum]